MNGHTFEPGHPDTLETHEVLALIERITDLDMGDRGHGPTVEAVAEATGHSPEEVRHILTALRNEKLKLTYEQRLKYVEDQQATLKHNVDNLLPETPLAPVSMAVTGDFSQAPTYYPERKKHGQRPALKTDTRTAKVKQNVWRSNHGIDLIFFWLAVAFLICSTLFYRLPMLVTR